MVSALLVKELREKTGAGMMDCKKALSETNGDFEKAIDWIRAKGLASAAKKADRIAAEGLVAAKIEGSIGAVIEVNSETDFVARNEQFQNLVRDISSLAIKHKDTESLKAATMQNGKTVSETIVDSIATIGENISLRRVAALEVTDGVVVSYVHNSVVEGLGKIAVIVALESTGNKEKLTTFGKQIAMHIAAAKPQSLTAAEIDQALIEKEREIFFEQSRASGKPDEIIAKMVDGRIRKFLEEVVLMDQVFVIDGKLRISEVVANYSKEIGAPIAIKAFVRYELGEGIEQQISNFAEEVAAVMKN